MSFGRGRRDTPETRSRPRAQWSEESLDGRGAVDTFLDRADVAVERDGAHTAATGESTFARAIGRALAGDRVAVGVGAGELAASIDLLRVAAGRSLPLLIVLENRALAAHGAATGTGHEAAHLAADAGAIVFSAADPQDAVDLALLGLIVAESALVPVVVAMDETTAHRTADVRVPTPALVRELAGTPADAVGAPTPAQRMTLGATRRRVPRWFDPDRPVLVGPTYDAETWALGAVGRDLFQLAPLASLVERARDHLTGAMGWAPSLVRTERVRRARRTLIVLGDATDTVVAAARENRAHVLALKSLSPLPDLADALRDANEVCVLEQAAPTRTGPGPLTREILDAFVRALESAPSRTLSRGRRPIPTIRSVYVGLGGRPVRLEDVAALCRADSLPDGPLYLGVSFGVDASTDPKRRILVERVLGDHPDAAARAIVGTPDATGSGPVTVPPRTAVRSERPYSLAAMRRTDDYHDSLPRFWGEVGLPIAEQRGVTLSPDPHLAAGTIPALSGALVAGGTPPEDVPRFVPTACTGCGICWIACPEGAIGPVALGVRRILDAAIARLAARGHDVSVLQPVLGKLADRTHRAIDAGGTTGQPAETSDTNRSGREAAGTFGPALAGAFGWLVEKMAPSAERRDALVGAFEALLAEVGDLPIARTRAFFDDPDARAPGAGELLTLAIDPGACTGCGLCIAECPEDALVAPGPEAGPSAQDALARAWSRWEWLPDTSGATIAAARERDDVGEAAGTFLTRHCLRAFGPGSTDEASASARIALRLVLGAIESQVQPAVRDLVSRIRSMEDALGTRLRGTLADALPTDDLAALEDGVAAFADAELTISKLAASIEGASSAGRLDAGVIQRLVTTARDLADLRWRLETAPTGLGRARAGLVVASSPRFASMTRFPINPFPQPVVVDMTGTSIPLVAGLASARARAALDDARTVHRAETLATARPSAGPEDPLEKLSDEDRRALAPLVLLADEDEMSPGTWGDLLALVRTDTPVLVLLLGRQAPDTGHDPGLALLALGGATVVQSTIAHADHLVAGIRSVLAGGGSGVVRVLAPVPDGDVTIDTVLDEARGAVSRGDVPLYVFRPGADGTRLSLDGNPDPDRAGAILTERAGLITAVADRTADEVRRADAERHAQALDTLRTEYEAKLAALRTDVELELADRLAANLMASAMAHVPSDPAIERAADPPADTSDEETPA